VSDVLAERAAERERLLELARLYVERLSARVEVIAAAVVGSVARGDFNVWSDVDVVVVAADLPLRAPDRGLLLADDAPGRVQPIGFLPEEFSQVFERRNPRRLKARAALEGRSLSEYLRLELEELAALPSLDEVLERVATREVVGGEPAAESIRAGRNARDAR
jgi:predicted nucleotidyltransferase